MVQISGNQLTEEEAAIYDRQIRLWGLESQNRLKQCQVLLVGMTSLGCEIAKNLVLAGIAGLGIVDDNLVTEQDIRTNFLVGPESVGMRLSEAVLPRTQELNPMVRIRSLSMPRTKVDTEMLKEFTLVLVCDPQFDQWFGLSEALIEMEPSSAPYLICTFTVGLYGAAFVDLGIHDFVAEDVVLKKVSSEKQTVNDKSTGTTETVYNKKTYKYPHLSEALTPNWMNNCTGSNMKHITKGFLVFQTLRECLDQKIPLELPVLQEQWKKTASRLGIPETLLSDEQLSCCCGPKVPAVDAVLGGVVAQEVVRAVTRKGAPHGNWYFMNGSQCSVTTDWLPKLDEILT